MRSLLQYENILLNTQYLIWWLPKRDRHSVDANIVLIAVHAQHIFSLLAVATKLGIS